MKKNRFGYYDGDCIDNAEVFNEVLGRKIGWVHFNELRHDWGAFYDNPLKYRGTAVVDMVNQWADEKLAVLQSYDGPVSYGAQYVMLDDLDEPYGYSENAPCDTYGPAACSSSCSNYARCMGWEK